MLPKILLRLGPNNGVEGTINPRIILTCNYDVPRRRTDPVLEFELCGST
jgi:hypothetical protein